MTVFAIVSRAACRMAAILFVAVMLTADGHNAGGILGSLTVEARGISCSEHSECGEGVYCINDECTTCLADPSVCLESEFCQYPDECFCDETWGECKEGIECLDEGYPQSGQGYCEPCDDVWHLCPTRPFEYWCSWNNECITDGECTDEYDCPNPYYYVCTQWGECVPIG